METIHRILGFGAVETTALRNARASTSFATAYVAAPSTKPRIAWLQARTGQIVSPCDRTGPLAQTR